MFCCKQAVIRLLVLSSMALGLVACAQVPAVANQSSLSVGAPYDGLWQGSGKTEQGQLITLEFNLQQSYLRGVTYHFVGRDGVPCTNISYNLLPEIVSLRMEDSRLSAPLGDDLHLDAVFDSHTSAMGTLVVNWQGRHNCTLKFDLKWKAFKKQAVQEISPQIAGVEPWCGRGNCLEVLLQLFIFGLSNGAVLALNAISVTVVYGTVRSLNLAHGDIFSLTSALVTSMLIGLNVRADWPPWILLVTLLLSLVAAMLFGLLLNVGLEFMAFRPFRGGSRLAPLIATLGISFVLFQAAMIWRTQQGSWIPGEHRSVPGLPEVPTDGIPNLLPTFDLLKEAGLSLHVTFGLNDLLVLLLAVACALVTHAFLHSTASGKAIRACVENPSLAEMIGVDLNAAIRRAFALGGILAGVAAFVFALYYGRPFGQNGAQSGLFAFTAAMLGGIGNPLGALASALLLGVFSSFSDYFISAEWTPALLLVLMVGLLLLRPEGFFSAGEAEDQANSVQRDDLTPARDPARQTGRSLSWMLAALAFVPLYTTLSGSAGQMIIVRGVGIYILLGLGLNILLGLAGVLDLGYAAAFGIGAYSAAILTNPWGSLRALLTYPPDYSLVFLVSVLLAGAFGALKGLVTARLRNDHLALATLASGLLVWRLVVNLKGLTAGAAGISALPAPHLLGLSLSGANSGYYLVYFVLVVFSLASQRLLNSRTGRAWRASSEDETAASASGVNIWKYRMMAFVVSSALAGAAGALYASTFAYVDPELLSFHWTVMLLTMVILGGAGNVSGVILGVALITGFDKVIIPQLGSLLAQFWPKDFFIGSVPDLRGTSFMNFGIILYLTVLLRGRGRKEK